MMISSQEKNSGGKRILVIDRSKTIQIILYTCLRNAGHLVHTYNTPQEALHALTVIQDFVPDIVFMCVGYEQGAYDFITYVKSQTTFARTRLVAMVLQEEKTSIQRTLNWSKVSYLVKPFQIQQAHALVSDSSPGAGSETRENEVRRRGLTEITHIAEDEGVYD